MTKYLDDDEAIWVVKGEDPNCDLGGPHVQPILGYFSGMHKHVLDYVKELKGWSQWGRGGDIERIEVTHIDGFSIAKRKGLLQEKKTLEARLKEIAKQL